MNILFATNKSDDSGIVLDFTARFQFTRKDVIIRLAFQPFSAGYLPLKRQKKKGSRSAAALSSADSPPFIITEAAEGDPDRAVINRAKEYRADLIVLAMKKPEAESLIANNIIRAVVFNSPKPVLVLRAFACKRPDKIKILFATDGSDAADATGMLLARLPFRENAEIAILNVIKADPADVLDDFYPGHIMKSIGSATLSSAYTESQKILKKSREYLSGKFRKTYEFSRVGDPTVITLSEAEAFKPDLIAVGYRGSMSPESLAGTMPKNLLRHSKCCVLIGKQC
jgi:nucleotide-binding universal stress UspA family protein